MNCTKQSYCARRGEYFIAAQGEEEHSIRRGSQPEMNSMNTEATRLVLRRPRPAVRRPYSNFWETPEANPVFWKPCFLIGEQRNRPSGALIVRQTRPFVRRRARLRNLRSKFKSGRCNTRSLRNGSQNAKGDPSGSPAPTSQVSVVAGARNTRFLRLIEQVIPRLAA